MIRRNTINQSSTMYATLQPIKNSALPINLDKLSLTKPYQLPTRDVSVYKMSQKPNLYGKFDKENTIYNKIQDDIKYSNLVEQINENNNNINYTPLYSENKVLTNTGKGNKSFFIDQQTRLGLAKVNRRFDKGNGLKTKLNQKKVTTVPMDTQTDKVYIQYPEKIKKRRIIDTYKNNIEANRNKIQDDYLNSNPFIVQGSANNVNTIFTTPFTPPSRSGDSQATVKNKNKAKLL